MRSTKESLSASWAGSAAFTASQLPIRPGSTLDPGNVVKHIHRRRHGLRKRVLLSMPADWRLLKGSNRCFERESRLLDEIRSRLGGWTHLGDDARRRELLAQQPTEALDLTFRAACLLDPVGQEALATGVAEDVGAPQRMVDELQRLLC